MRSTAVNRTAFPALESVPCCLAEYNMYSFDINAQGNSARLDYRSLSDLLLRSGAKTGAAECHGFLCGQICGTESPDEELWKEFIDARTPDDSLADQCYAELRELAEIIENQFRSLEYEFELFLPDEDTPITERVDALGCWCHGFLSGIGLIEDIERSALTADSQELLKDFSMICRAGVDEPDEEDERALTQVVEYVRVGVMTIFEELRFQSPARDASGVWH